jgi:hypothetical protein
MLSTTFVYTTLGLWFIDDVRDSKNIKNIFFSFIFFGGLEAPFLYLFSSAALQRTAYIGVPLQMVAHPRIGSPL